MGSIKEEFVKFITKGNLVQLAVAFVLGLAFSALITALVGDIFTPLIGVAGKFDFSTWNYTVNGSTFQQGAFLNQVISFALVAVVLFFHCAAVPTVRGPSSREEAGTHAHDPRVPRMPLDDPDSGEAVHVLHFPGPPGRARGPSQGLEGRHRVDSTRLNEPLLAKPAGIARATRSAPAGVTAPREPPRNPDALSEPDDLRFREAEKGRLDPDRFAALDPGLRRQACEVFERPQELRSTVGVPGVIDRVRAQIDRSQPMALGVSEGD